MALVKSSEMRLCSLLKRRHAYYMAILSSITELAHVILPYCLLLTVQDEKTTENKNDQFNSRGATHSGIVRVGVTSI